MPARHGGGRTRPGLGQEAHIARSPKAPTGGEETPKRRGAATGARTAAPKRATAKATPKRAVTPAAGPGKATAKPAAARTRTTAAKPGTAAARKAAAPKAATAPRKPAPAKAPARPKPATPAAEKKTRSAAGPSAAAPQRPRKKVAPDRLEALVAAARQSLEDDKAEEIVVLDVTGRADFTDRMIIATGQVERQLQAMAVHVEEALEKAGKHLRRSDIQASPDWVLIDAGDLVIHLFRPEARVTYALERMWGPESPAPDR
ncbi:ribosome silencing factor [Paracraurococcus lichenis]|uniref:Ribosomal silencing factor RsfS n=1 Tax=Paracraurococcus lichenis TaxID=3064888 RepID=A0ABT9E723_9PROT|nr:ribosome silencing factor [Paracraurococcus sp. LOR1-02]MDO9711929.1 ribosome silencing factor [Paracraurococcus sp. LOR1-02]